MQSIQAPKRVVLSYPFGGTAADFGKACVAALEELGCAVFPFDSSRNESSLRIQGLLKTTRHLMRLQAPPRVEGESKHGALEASVNSARPHVLLILRGDSYAHDFIRYLKEQYRIPHVVCWWIEGPKWQDLMLQEAQIYDAYYCIHRDGYPPKSGIRYLPAVSTVDNALLRSENRAYKRDITFIGKWKPRRQNYLESIADLDVSIFGPKWLAKNLTNPSMLRHVKGSRIHGHAVTRAYAHSKIGLDVPSWDISTSLTLRIADIPASGCFLLTQDSPSLREYFEVGKHIDVFTTPEELSDKARFYLTHETTRECMAAAAFVRAKSLPTLAQRLKQLLEPII